MWAGFCMNWTPGWNQAAVFAAFCSFEHCLRASGTLDWARRHTWYTRYHTLRAHDNVLIEKESGIDHDDLNYESGRWQHIFSLRCFQTSAKIACTDYAINDLHAPETFRTCLCASVAKSHLPVWHHQDVWHRALPYCKIVGLRYQKFLG